MNHDWMTAAEAIQKRLLPCRRLTFSGLHCEAYYRPFHNIGGDYYDFVPLDRSKLGFAIGDVSGKGVEAALTMANLQASLRALLLNQETRPSTLVRTLNQLLYHSSLPHIYATLFYGEYDAETRVLSYVNAGHYPPLIVRQEGEGVRLIRLESDGIPIGIFPDADYQGESCPLQPGDLLVGYTDGITESCDKPQEFWGLAGLEGVLLRCIGRRPGEVIEAILSERKRVSPTNTPADDMTLVVATIEEAAGCPPMKSAQDLETTTPCRDAVQAGTEQVNKIAAVAAASSLRAPRWSRRTIGEIKTHGQSQER